MNRSPRSAANESNVPPSAPQNRKSVTLTVATPSSLPISNSIGLTLVSSGVEDLVRFLFDHAGQQHIGDAEHDAPQDEGERQRGVERRALAQRDLARAGAGRADRIARSRDRNCVEPFGFRRAAGPARLALRAAWRAATRRGRCWTAHRG